GNGPFKVVNTYLEAAGENIMLGGCDPTWVGSYPQDIEIRNDYFYKQLAWRSLPPATQTSVKNLFELKSGQRVLVQDSILENNWMNGQNGTAILFTPGNQHGSNVTLRVQDVTFDRVVLRHTTHAINVTAASTYFPSAYTRRLLFKDMLFQDVGGGAASPWVAAPGTCDNSCGQFMNT